MWQLLQHCSGVGSRSTALQSLVWALGILLSGLSTSIWAGAPFFVVIILAVTFSILFLTFIGAYLYLLVKDRDALRSEQFTLSKMAIEKGYVGDNIIGIIKNQQFTGTESAIDASNIKEIGQ